MKSSRSVLWGEQAQSKAKLDPFLLKLNKGENMTVLVS